jgi:hypothetical protein
MGIETAQCKCTAATPQAAEVVHLTSSSATSRGFYRWQARRGFVLDGTGRRMFLRARLVARETPEEAVQVALPLAACVARPRLLTACEPVLVLN